MRPFAHCLPARPACPAPSPAACVCASADRHGYDPFVFELDLKPFGVHQPKITLQVSSRWGGWW